MKNIYEILKAFGIEIPEDKKEAFNKELSQNYKTIKEVTSIQDKLERAETERDGIQSKYDEDIKKRDGDLEALKVQLQQAGTDTEKLSTLQKEFDTLKSTYDASKNEYETKLSKQAYEFAVKEEVASLKFTSNSAKKAFMQEVLAKGLQMEQGKILGFADFVEKYKESDADAFATEDSGNDKNEAGAADNKPNFGGKTSVVDNNGSTSKENKATPIIW